MKSYGNKLSSEAIELKKFIEGFRSMKELYEGKREGKGNVELLIPKIEKFGEYLAKTANLKTSQIRKFFDAVKKIQNETRVKKSGNIRARILRIKPQLAYATAKQPRQLKDFADVVHTAIDKVKDEKDFEYFVEFVEAIVAYHKYYGGRD